MICCKLGEWYSNRDSICCTKQRECGLHCCAEGRNYINEITGKCCSPDKKCGTACCEPDNPLPGFINLAFCANAARSLCCVTNEIDYNGLCCKSTLCCNGVCCGAGTACLDGVCAVPPPDTKEHCLLLSVFATGDLCNTLADCKPPGLQCAQGCCFLPPPA